MSATIIAVPVQTLQQGSVPSVSVSSEIADLFQALGLSELVQRSLLAYEMTDEDLKDVLLESTLPELEMTPMLETPAALAKDLRPVKTGETWAVVDGLGMTRATGLESATLAEAMCGLISNECKASTEFGMHPDFVPAQ
jgi:hypothetical protein